MQDPLAYFISFHTYGTWLHGRDEGSVDYQHKTYGQPHLPTNKQQETARKNQMKDPEVRLNHIARTIVLHSLLETCEYRTWQPHAIHIRENHVHLVVTAKSTKPEKVLGDLKAYATRALRKKNHIAKDASVWSEHGSTRYLWDQAAVYEKCHYTLHEQGKPMQRWPADGRILLSEHEA